MILRHFAMRRATLVGPLALALSVAFTAAPVGAAPRITTAPTARAATVTPTEISKVVLDEESIDGPSLWSIAAYEPEPVPNAPFAAIGWTGTDPAHSLNVMLSRDGQSFDRKLTLAESSLYRPSVIVVRQNNANLVIVAWTGTDPNRSLNILYDAYGTRRKVTIDDSSGAAPSLAFAFGQVWLAWAGTDPNQSLNVRAMGTQGLTPGTKTILSQYHATGRPSLIANTRDHLLMLTWSYAEAPHYINFAISPNGASWSTPLPAPAPQTSFVGPDILALNPPPAVGTPGYFWAWTGTDPLRSLNLATSEQYSNWPAPITTIAEQALGGPSLGYVGVPGRVLLAWTGTDPLHHMNLGIFQVA
ncbi:MAG: hypothetical protein IVW57_05045 [Ktedonobacterales bacterium]|nr:hypothetical protein [Ktedonobacterales bacterium]